MADTFRPVDYQPLDFMPGAQLIMAARRAHAAEDMAKENAATQRMFAENTAKRESATAVREAAKHTMELEDRAHRQEVARSNMLLPTSPLMRAARQVGAAGASSIGKPYGISFNEEQEPPPSIAGHDLFKAAGNAYGNFAKDALAGNSPTPPTPDEAQLDAISGGEAPPSDAAPPPVHEEPSPLDQVQQQLDHPQARPSKLFAAAGGQRFEVPTVSDSTGLGEKYDQVYNEVLRRTGDEGKAYTAALHMREKDAVIEGAGARLTQSLDSRADLAGTYKRDVGEQDARDRFMADEAMKRTIASGKYKVAAAGSGFKQEGANDRGLSLLDRRMENVKRTTAWSKLVNEDRTVRGLMTNIASGTVPLQHKDAQIQLARFFRQAQPTEGEMHMLYNNLGGTMDKWNQFVSRITNGDLSGEQMRQLKASADQVSREHNEAVQRTYEAVKHTVGDGSGFEQMPDNVNSYVRGMFADLGVEVPDVYGNTEGGITIGSKSAPKAKPKKKATGAAPDHEDDNAFLNRILK